MASLTRPIGLRDGIPIYDYPTDPVTPPVTVIRLHPAGLPEKRRHIHAFPILTYLPSSGSVYVVAAGETIDPSWVSEHDDGIAVFFDPAALDEGTRSPWPTWRTHPLLFPFLHGHTGGLLHLQVPALRKKFWDNAVEAMEAELLDRREGYRQAALAHLTLVLIELARMTDDVVGDLRRSGEHLIADVFAVIERRIDEPLSLRDVAREVGLTPGISRPSYVVAPVAPLSSGSSNAGCPRRVRCSEEPSSRSPRSHDAWGSRMPATSPGCSAAPMACHRGPGGPRTA